MDIRVNNELNNRRRRRKKKQRIDATMLIFIVFIGLFLVVGFFTIERDFSPAENRTLAPMPDFSFEKLFFDETKWTMDYETYATDQFVLRDEWVWLKAGGEKLIGKKENGGTYFADNGYLIEKPRTVDLRSVSVNVNAINGFESGVPKYFALIPNTIYINRDKLPKFAPHGAQDEFIDGVYAKVSGAKTVDVKSVLEQNADKQLFYRTDHHPTTLGAYYIYIAVAREMGIAPLSFDRYELSTVADDFRGTAFAAAGAWWVASDDIEICTPSGLQASTEGFERGEVTELLGIYDFEKLLTADKYNVFLGGNYPLSVISTNAKTGRNLLIIKDSFGLTVAPFFAPHFDKIAVVDMRYNKNPVSELIAQYGITDMLFLYNVNNFISDKNMAFLE